MESSVAITQQDAGAAASHDVGNAVAIDVRKRDGFPGTAHGVLSRCAKRSIPAAPDICTHGMPVRGGVTIQQRVTGWRVLRFVSPALAAKLEGLTSFGKPVFSRRKMK